MKKQFTKVLPVMLAGLLQVAPIMRNLFIEARAWAPCSWAVVLKIATGAVAIFGYHAISSASSIAVSPANATVGQAYVGTVTYSGGHASQVSSMALSNNLTSGTLVCLGASQTLGNGLSIVYSGGNKATVTGTPSAAGNLFFRVAAYDAGGCGSGETDRKQATTLIIGTGGGGGVAPAITATPQNVMAQVGSDVLLSGGASGNPIPRYYWYLGPPSAGNLVSTNSSLVITNVGYTNAGLYSMVASNASGKTADNGATAFVTTCLTPGSNMCI